LEEGIKSFFPIALICTTRCRIPANASANQGPKKAGLILTMVAELRPLLAPSLILREKGIELKPFWR
jgi:hypothetical protein